MNLPIPMKKRQLKRGLIIKPLLMLLLAAVAILLVTFFVTDHFMEEQEKEAINERFQQLHHLYLNEENPPTETDNIFNTSYMIIDEDYNRYYVSHQSEDEEGLVEALSILNYVDADMSEQLDELAEMRRGVEVEIDGNYYVVDVEAFEGVVEGDHIAQGGNGQIFYAIVFINTTSMYVFLAQLTVTIIYIVIVILLITLMSFVWAARRLSLSFDQLSHYIVKVGQKEKLEPMECAYVEFDEIIQTVDHMAALIQYQQRSQELFFQNSSHELRTPLMSIQGYAEGIKEGVITDTEAAATVIFEESKKMTALVDEILTLSKAESQETALQMSQFSLREFMDDMAWRFKAKADEKGIVFHFDVSPGDINIHADEQQFERAIKNILGNAIRYAQSLILIEIRENRETVELKISNDGPAIPPKDIEHIFERFFKGEGGQYGIGLALTKTIITQHKGELFVESNDDLTTFKIMMPK